MDCFSLGDVPRYEASNNLVSCFLFCVRGAGACGLVRLEGLTAVSGKVSLGTGLVCLALGIFPGGWCSRKGGRHSPRLPCLVGLIGRDRGSRYRVDRLVAAPVFEPFRRRSSAGPSSGISSPKTGIQVEVRHLQGGSCWCRAVQGWAAGDLIQDTLLENVPRSIRSCCDRSSFFVLPWLGWVALRRRATLVAALLTRPAGTRMLPSPFPLRVQAVELQRTAS